MKRTWLIGITLAIVVVGVGGGVWKWRSGLTPHYTEAAACGVPSDLVVDLVGSDRFTADLGFGRRCTVRVGGFGSEGPEVEFWLGSPVEESWPWNLRTILSSPNRVDLNDGQGGFARDEGNIEGLWVCGKFWRGQRSLSVDAIDTPGTNAQFEKVFRAAVDYAGGCAAQDLPGPFDPYTEQKSCETRADLVQKALGTDLFRSFPAPGRPVDVSTNWWCTAVTDTIGGRTGSLVVAIQQDNRTWSDERARILDTADPFPIADGHAYVDITGPRIRAFWACDQEGEKGGKTAVLAATSITQQPIQHTAVVEMVTDIAEATGCP